MQKTLEKLTALGSPWHGLVEGGQLALPNGQSMAYPQPWYNEWSDAGRTLYQKMPWAPGATRTPEQAVADAAAGMQWRDDVLLTGSGIQLYGQQINGWIYAGPDGKPWHIEASLFQGVSIGTSFSGTLRVALFGRVNAEPEVHEVPLSLASTGQSTPALTGTSPRGEVLDITPDGSKAIIMLWAPTDRPWWDREPALDKLSTGFLLLTLTGTPGVDFVASLTVLRTRGQTLGTVTDTGPIAQEEVRYYTDSSVTESSETIYVGEADCSGYMDIINTPNGYPTSTSGNTGSFGVAVAQGERTQRIKDRIVAMWFVNGLPSEVTLSLEQHYSVDAPPLQQSVSGTDHVRFEHTGAGVGGTCELGEPQRLSWYNHSVTRAREEQVTIRYTLAHSGSSVQWQCSRHVVTEYHYQRGEGGVTTETFSTVVTVATSNGSDSGYADSSAFGIGAGSNDGGAAGFSDDYRFRLAEGPGVQSQDLQKQYGFGWLRYSNNLIGIYQRNDDYSDGTVQFHFGPAFYPGGQHAGTSQHSAIRRYGSYNPATGQVIRNQLNPVCWT